MSESVHCRGLKEVIVYLKSFDARRDAFLRNVSRELARQAMTELMQLAPRDMKGYAQAFTLGEGTVGGVFGGVAWVPPQKALLMAGDASVTVLYVVPKSGVRGKKLEALQLLQAAEPWTMETMPYYPLPGEAEMVSRRVTANEVTRLVARHKRERGELVEQLEALEIQVRPVGATAPPHPVMQDIAFEALRHEFGIGMVAVPHFRPMQRKMVASGAEKVIARLAPTLQDPKNKAWRSERRLPVVQGADLENIGAFQSEVIL